MDYSKRVKTARLITALSSVAAVISYVVGILYFKVETLFSEVSGNFFQIMSKASDVADFFGVNSGNIIEMLLDTMDDEEQVLLFVVFTAIYTIPLILWIISAISGITACVKKSNSKGSAIITLITSIFTALAAALFALGVAYAQNEMVYDVISLGAGWYIQVVALIVGFGSSIALLAALKAQKKNGKISATDVGLVGVCGMWTNAEFFNNSGNPIVIGRDPSQCDVVISQNSEKVSRKHCTVGYDYKNNMYIITDHSSNGTYLDDGRKLVQGMPTPVECGHVVIIGDEKNAFKLN